MGCQPPGVFRTSVKDPRVVRERGYVLRSLANPLELGALGLGAWLRVLFSVQISERFLDIA